MLERIQTLSLMLNFNGSPNSRQAPVEKVFRELCKRSRLGALRTSQFHSRRATNDEAGNEQSLVAATVPGSLDTWAPRAAIFSHSLYNRNV